MTPLAGASSPGQAAATLLEPLRSKQAQTQGLMDEVWPGPGRMWMLLTAWS
jgi:hypothetical protein